MAANPDLPIILGQGYNPTLMGGFPTAAELDEIVPDKVAIIIDFTIHNAWLNTKAMEAGNVTKETPNVTPIFSADWAGQGEEYPETLGEERTRTQVGQYRKLADAGNKLSLAGDYPSSPMSNNSMLYQIYGAVTFKDPFDTANSKPFPPGVPPLDLEQAIKAVTINPAWQLRMEDKLGSVEVGKLADLVILDRNIMELDVPEELLETKVLATIMDGEFRFRDGL